MLYRQPRDRFPLSTIFGLGRTNSRLSTPTKGSSKTAGRKQMISYPAGTKSKPRRRPTPKRSLKQAGVALKDEDADKLLLEAVREETDNAEADNNGVEVRQQTEEQETLPVQVEVADVQPLPRTRLSGCKLSNICARRICCRLVFSSFRRRDASKMPTRCLIKISAMPLRRVLSI